jgi:hypothetical protein
MQTTELQPTSMCMQHRTAPLLCILCIAPYLGAATPASADCATPPSLASPLPLLLLVVVLQGYLVGVAVKGVGYRMEPVEEAVVAAALSSKAGPGAVRRMYWEQEAEKNNPPYPYPNPVKAVRLKVCF